MVSTASVTLPPGQRRINGFPRFGSHFHHPPPDIPDAPAIEIGGAVREPFTVPLVELATLPRCEITADFHCVAGWSATGLRWEGVAFETFYRLVILPSVPADASITHVVFEGLDGYRSIALIEDALAEDVLIAEQLDDRPLDDNPRRPCPIGEPTSVRFHQHQTPLPDRGSSRCASRALPPLRAGPDRFAAGQAAPQGQGVA
jgi:DMSO/TMAO reductase YedYZ molybdopterin-dependent catalytic subunit